jgi:hypothetical protein
MSLCVCVGGGDPMNGAGEEILSSQNQGPDRCQMQVHWASGFPHLPNEWAIADKAC